MVSHIIVLDVCSFHVGINYPLYSALLLLLLNVALNQGCLYMNKN